MTNEARPGSLGLVIGAAVVLVAGIGIAWMDSRPTWDDTGVTAISVATVAAGGALAGVPWWLVSALAAGPLLVAELSGGQGVLLAVPFALVGTFAGAQVRKWGVKP